VQKATKLVNGATDHKTLKPAFSQNRNATSAKGVRGRTHRPPCATVNTKAAQMNATAANRAIS